MQLQHVARQPVLRRPLAQRAQARERLLAQLLDPLLGHRFHDITEGLQRPRAGEQQVPAYQVRKAEIGIVADQRIDMAERLVEAIGLDRLEHRRQAVLGGGGKRRDRDEHGQQEKSESHHLADFSSRISQRPPALARTSVLRLELFSLSER